MGCTKSKPENIKITSVLLSNKMRGNFFWIKKKSENWINKKKRLLKGENVTNQRGTFNVSGEGSILANTPILQERSQFEVKIIKKGAFCLGLAGKGINFGNALFCQPNVWCLNVDDHIISIGEDKIELELPIDYNIGDIFVRISFSLFFQMDEIIKLIFEK